MFATTDRFVRTLLLAVKTVRYRTAMVKSAHGVLRTGQCGFRDVTPGTIEASPGPGSSTRDEGRGAGADARDQVLRPASQWHDPRWRDPVGDAHRGARPI
jgi:hypothetical protein